MNLRGSVDGLPRANRFTLRLSAPVRIDRALPLCAEPAWK